jgi:hypothetical protein
MRLKSLLALTAIVGVCLLTSASAQAQAEYTVEGFNAPPPADLADPIKAELAPAALRVKKGTDTLCEIWLRNAIPTETPTNTLGRSYPQIPDTVLLGAIRVVSPMKDNRSQSFPIGTYLMRHGIQPQNGDHTGSTDFIDFALLLNAKTDRTVNGTYTTPQDMMKQSIADKGADHPIVFALLPPKAASQPSLAKNEKDFWILEAKAGNVVLAIVIVGSYEH